MSDSKMLEDLQAQVRDMSAELNRLSDINAIRRIQHAYGYYIDRCLYDEAVDLFSDVGEVWFMGGAFKGKAGVRRLYCERFRQRFTDGVNGPVYGFLLDHLQLQDIIDISADRTSAFGRFRGFMQAGSHESREKRPGVLPAQWWEGGVYENEYIRENGIWKLRILNYRLAYQGLFETGWAKWEPSFSGTFKTTYPTDPLGPDELIDPAPVFWPDTEIVPFHYQHPVTGKPWRADD